MANNYIAPPKYGTGLLLVLALPLLYFISRQNYLLFHSLADGVSIVISASIFTIIWNGRRRIDNDYFLYVGIGFLFFAFWDFLHLLGNKNMGVFPEYGNLGPALYIVSRYILSISLIIAPLFINRKLNFALMYAGYSLVTLLILLSIFYWHTFPVCIVEGAGLTPFKVVSDYIICLILLLAIVLLLINRRWFDSRVLRLIVSSLILSIATGLAFTLYSDPFGILNAIGHFFQIASFYLIYLAFIDTTLTKPQDILYNKLKTNEAILQQEIVGHKQSAEHLRTHELELEMQNEELRRTQLELGASRARYFELYDLAPVGYCTISEKGLILEANLTVATMLGATRLVLDKQPISRFIFPEDHHIHYEHLKQLLEFGEPQTWEMRVLKQDGVVFWAHLEAIAAQQTDGAPECRITMSDINDRKRAEVAVKENEKKFRLAFENAKDTIIWANSETGIIIDCNTAATELFEKPRGYLVGSHQSTLHPSGMVEHYRDMFTDQARDLRSGVEAQIITGAGVIKTVTITVSNTEFEGNKIIQGIFRDITERKKAAESIEASLREKETLLKEIHHRVKNNLQIISSLLNLQSGYVGDEKMKGIFKECQDRIMSMADVHQLLYKSQNFTKIDFGEYSREMASHLFRSYKTGDTDIALTIDARNIMLPIDAAISCGLIINELLTNALKYAFPGVRKGEIKMEMTRTKEGVKLLFEDNGIGFPIDMDFYKAGTLGLKLVRLLVEQLDGSIKQDTGNGTRYVIMFETETPREI